MRMAWPRERISFDNRLIIIKCVTSYCEHMLRTALGGWESKSNRLCSDCKRNRVKTKNYRRLVFMKVWRIHIKNDVAPGYSREDLLDFCLKEKLIGVGWGEIKTRDNDESIIRKQAQCYS